MDVQGAESEYQLEPRHPHPEDAGAVVPLSWLAMEGAVLGPIAAQCENSAVWTEGWIALPAKRLRMLVDPFGSQFGLR